MARESAERAVNPFRAAVPTATPAPAPGPSPDPRPSGPSPTRLPAPEVVLREMTGFEEEYIEREAASDNTARLVNGVLARCLCAAGEDSSAALARVRALSIADRDLLLIRLRQMSLGSAVETEVDCPTCGAANAASFDLSALPLDVARPLTEFSAQLPDGHTAVLRQPSAGDQEAMLDAGLGGAAERLSWLIGRLLLRLGEASGPFDARTARALPVAARTAIESALEAEVPDLDLGMSLTCHACGDGFAAPFDVAAFFLPR